VVITDLVINTLLGRVTLDPAGMHRRIADEYCGGAAVTKFPTKYFRIEFTRREFVVRVIGTLLVVLFLPYIY